MKSVEERGDVEEYYPHYIIPSEVEFDYAYYECRCGWASEAVPHPCMLEHHADGHREYGYTPDCGLGKKVLVFKDGGVAEI